MISNEENRLGRSLPINSLLILSALQTLRRASLHELADKIHVNEMRTKANVEKLVETGLVEAIGNTSARTYILSSKVYRDQDNMTGYVRQTGIDLIKHEELIIKLAKTQRGIVTRENVVALLGVTPPQAYRMLKRLTDSGKLKLVGSGRVAHYEIVK
jgi:ATP-dependent DNA helicase RecG